MKLFLIKNKVLKIMGEYNKESSRAGLSLIGVVQVVFLVLKLTGTEPVSNWEWLYIMMPLIISTGLILCGCVSVGICGCCYICLTKENNKSETTTVTLSIEDNEIV